MQAGEKRDPIMALVLAIVTCGLYMFYWVYKSSEELNAGLGRQDFNPAMEVGLSFLTCGLWMIWWDWRAANAIYEMEQMWGQKPKMEPALLFLTGLFGLGPLFFQLSMNNAWEGQPQIAGHQPPRIDGPGF